MRKVMSLSLPATRVQTTKKISKQRGYPSVSAYVQKLLEEDAEVISEEELLRDVEIARKEYREGNVIRAKSLADLI